MMLSTSHIFVKVFLGLNIVTSFLLAAVSGICGEPPEIDEAYHDGGTLTEYPEGRRLSYTCNFGFYRDGNGLALCRNGEWVGLILTCTPKSCGDPGLPTHGSRDKEVFTFGNDITYSCDQGYNLMGASWIICQADGTWSGTAPACEPVQCPLLPAPQFGSVFPSTERTYGTEVKVECEDDYELAGSAVRRCQADRTWSGEEGVCNKVGCKIPYLQDGSIDGENVQIADVIYFICSPNTTRDGEFSAVCVSKNTWSTTIPKCWRKCKVPEIEHGIPVLQSGENALAGEGMIRNDIQLFFQCEVGYKLDNPDPARCNNGTLGHVSRCVEEDYVPPTKPTVPGVSTDVPPTEAPSGGFPMWAIVVIAIAALVLCIIGIVVCYKKCGGDKEDPEKPAVKFTPDEEEKVFLDEVPERSSYRDVYCHFYLENGSAPLILSAHSDPEGHSVRCIAIPKKGDPEEFPEEYIWYEHAETNTLRNAHNHLCLDATERGAFLEPYMPGNRTQQWSCAYNTIQNRHNSDWVIALPPRNSKSRQVCATKYNKKIRSKWIAYKTGRQPRPAATNNKPSSDGSLLNSPSSDDTETNL